MKKLISMVCAVCISMCIQPLSFAKAAPMAFGDLPTGGVAKVIGESIPAASSGAVYKGSNESGEEDKTLYEVLEEGMRRHDEIVDISRFGYTTSAADKKTVLDVLYRVVCENYDILSFTGFYPVSKGNNLVGVKPFYLFESYSEDVQKRAEMDAKINEYIALAEDVPETVGKILIVHDAFCADNEYATEELAGYNKKDAEDLTYDDTVIFSAYGALINNRAVCQGISIILAEIYNRMGIETGFCQSDALVHIWNLIKVDGKWYQLDATWNDSDLEIGKDEDGKKILGEKCYHNYFLSSDSEFLANHVKKTSTGGQICDWEYYTDEGEVSCTDKTYESGQIYNGDYIYEGKNYGTYYGNIAWDGDSYVIDVWALQRYLEATAENGLEKSGVYIVTSGFDKFYSKHVKSNGIIATKRYQTVTNGADGTTTANRIMFFANESMEGTADLRYALFDGKSLNAVGTIFTLPQMASSGFSGLNMGNLLVGGKMFLWKSGTQQPVSEVIEYK